MGLRAPTEDHGPTFMPANKCALYLILLSLHLSDISSLFIYEVIWICMLMNAASRRSTKCRQPKEPKSLHLRISGLIAIQVLRHLWISAHLLQISTHHLFYGLRMKLLKILYLVNAVSYELQCASAFHTRCTHLRYVYIAVPSNTGYAFRGRTILCSACLCLALCNRA